MVKFGILTFSDCRAIACQEMLPFNLEFQKRLIGALEKTGEVQVIAREEIIQTPKQARAGAERSGRVGVDGMLFHFVGWSFPRLATVVASSSRGPFLL